MQSVSETEADLIGESHRMGAGGVAALSLFAANAGLFVLYFLLDLTLFQLVFVYWWEALWIGLFSGLKLLTASLFGSPYENRWVDVSRGSGIFLSLLAIMKSAGAFMILLVFTGVALVVAQQELSGTDGTDFVREQALLILKCSLIFFVSHGLSFILNFLVLGEFRRARFGTLLWQPFKRSLALFVTVVASLTALQAYPGILSMTTYPALLIVVKLAWDYYLHKRERLSFTASGIKETRPK
jgi:hypothetical protein